MGRRSGDLGIDVSDYKRLVRGLGQADKELAKTLKRSTKAAAKIVTDETRTRARSGSARARGARDKRRIRGRRDRRKPAYTRAQARSGTRQQRKAATGIKPSSTARGARITVANTAARPFTMGAFFGSGGARFGPWIGNRFDLAKGTGPYLLADSFVDKRDAMFDAVGAGVDKALSQVATTTR